ncbi:MAG TPA: Xaa-Pro peptidase family protein [Candidatus Eisenbacteria bacterium]|nr:Xaa-Pro peptidase family protein [Candidatus Eisenbacteria bacterium]
MRADIDTLLAERGCNAALVLKTETPNPTFRFLTGPRAELSTGVLVWRRGAKAHLVHASMERDGAATTGFDLSTHAERGWKKIVEAEGSSNAAYARLFDELLRDLGVTGRIVVDGTGPVGRYAHILRRLRERRPDLELIEDGEPDLFLQARFTKDEAEVAEVRKVGAVCAAAYARVREIISKGRLDGKRLRDADGWVTVGRLRLEIRRIFFEAGLEEPGGNIVAQGRDAAVPHNSGNDADVLEEGASIAIDLYPVQAGGGYYFDVTRTYCVGRASDELRAIHACVRDSLRDVIDALEPQARARSYQDRVCDFFEKRGHRTIRQDDRTEEGYVHGLGHGIGLEVHERPYLGGPPHNADRIEPGSLFTLEPGLYYPSRGMGVRLEDVIYARPDGTFENLADRIPYDLEIAPAS